MTASPTLQGVDGAVHGVTKFMDWTAEEFRKRMLGYHPTGDGAEVLDKDDEGEFPPVPTGIAKDWSGTLTTPVKDQVDPASDRVPPCE
jgi:hypothetical protein